MPPRKGNQKPTTLSITEFAIFRIFRQEQNVQMTHLACDSQLELNYTKRDLDPPTPTSLIIDRSHPYLRREDLESSRVFSKVHLQALTVTAMISFVWLDSFFEFACPTQALRCFSFFRPLEIRLFFNCKIGVVLSPNSPECFPVRKKKGKKPLWHEN